MLSPKKNVGNRSKMDSEKVRLIKKRKAERFSDKWHAAREAVNQQGRDKKAEKSNDELSLIQGTIKESCSCSLELFEKPTLPNNCSEVFIFLVFVLIYQLFSKKQGSLNNSSTPSFLTPSRLIHRTFSFRVFSHLRKGSSFYLKF